MVFLFVTSNAYYGMFQARPTLNFVEKKKTTSVLLYEFHLDLVNAMLYFDFCFEYISYVGFLAIALVV